MNPRRNPTAEEWEDIKAEWRVGAKSTRVIAKEHGVTEGAVRKRATKEGWIRDLAQAVRMRTRAKIAGDDGPPPGALMVGPGQEFLAAKAEDEAIVEVAAERNVQVIAGHKQHVKNLSVVCAQLVADVSSASRHRGELEELIVLATSTGPNGGGSAVDWAKRQSMLRAISLPQHAATLRDLATTSRILILLERQAFGIDENEQEDSYEDLLRKALASAEPVDGERAA